MPLFGAPLGGGTLSMVGEGFAAFWGCDDDIMPTAGYHIAPPEIELVLLSHSGVGVVAVAQGKVRKDKPVIAGFTVMTWI
jgi:acyl-coenzyme A synthetase/AMP-(fatty) acid ligase